MTDDSPPPSAPIPEPLTARLDALEQKLAAHRTSRLAQVGAVAGLVGLTISIINGLFTLLDATVRKPDAERAAQYSAFKSDMRTLVSLTQEISGAMLPDGSINVANANAANIKIQSTMEDIGRLLRLLGKAAEDRNGKYYVGSYDYCILGQAAYGGGNLDAALRYVDACVRAADNPHSKGEALRVKALMIFQVRGPAGVGQSLETMGQALTLAQGRTDPGAPTDRANVLASMASVEAFSGRCADAADHALQALRAGADLPTVTQRYIRQMVAGGLAGQERCPIGRFPEAVRALASPPAPGPALVAASAPGPAPPAAAAPLPPTPVKLSLTCRFTIGPRSGQSQSYEGVPGVTPVPVGAPCADGQGSFGQAE
jgi:hypothetical protein